MSLAQSTLYKASNQLCQHSLFLQCLLDIKKHHLDQNLFFPVDMYIYRPELAWVAYEVNLLDLWEANRLS